MRLSLITAGFPQNEFGGLGRIVAALEPGRVQKNPQDLRVGSGGPTREYVERRKHPQAAGETPKEIERGGPDNEREEEQPTPGAPDRQRFVYRFVNAVADYFGRHRRLTER